MAAVFALFDAIITIAIVWGATTLADYDRMVRENPELKTALVNLLACQALRLVFVVIAFLGGYFAVKRLNWGLSIVGGIMGILAVITGLLWIVFPVWGLIELVLFLGAILAVVMVGISRKEFMLV